jgi:hypothetical protein
MNKCKTPDPIRSEQKRDVASPKETPGRRRGKGEGRRRIREKDLEVPESGAARYQTQRQKCNISAQFSQRNIARQHKRRYSHPQQRKARASSQERILKGRGAKGMREVCCEIHKSQPKPIRSRRRKSVYQIRESHPDTEEGIAKNTLMRDSRNRRKGERSKVAE